MPAHGQQCLCGDPSSCTCPHSTQPNGPYHTFQNPAAPQHQSLWPYQTAQTPTPVPPSYIPYFPNHINSSDSANPSPRIQAQFHHWTPVTFNNQIPSQRPVLSNITPTVNNSESIQVSQAGSKRKKSSNPTSAAAKRRRTAPCDIPFSANSTFSSPAIPGVGPPSITPNSNPLSLGSISSVHECDTPASRYGSILAKSKVEHSTQAASDVWFFMRPLPSREKPSTLPENEPTFKERPKSEYVGCRLCTGEEWTVWKNNPGQTTAIRNHLIKNHKKTYRELVLLQKLKGWLDINGSGSKKKSTPSHGTREPFSLEGFYERLIRWVVADDQSINVIDCPELRDLLLFLGTDLNESDLPHRTKLTQLIVERFRVEYQKMLNDINNSLGRVSITSDLWSSQDLSSYMAVTAHWSAEASDGRLIIRSQLIAFRHVKGSHTGANLAQVLFNILKELNILSRLGMFTLDNASNNDTLMEEFANLSRDHGIPFDKDGNRIRCFPHVVNIAVKAGLKHLTHLPPSEEDDDYSTEPGDELNNALRNNAGYLGALRSDIVASCRSLVTACRASGKRREDFAKTIEDGNSAGGWGLPGEKEPLRRVALLRDVDTRWSSTFLMVDRVLELYPAIQAFLEKPAHSEISWHQLSPIEQKVLADIREYLYIPHTVQELVSAEKTPTVSIVIPAYEDLIELLRDRKHDLPEIAHALEASAEKLDEYLAKSRKTRIYALAMILNPTVKFAWLESHWNLEECNAARRFIRDAMLEYRRIDRQNGTSNPSTAIPRPTRQLMKFPSASNAARAQMSGLARLKSLKRGSSTGNVTLPSSLQANLLSDTQTDVEREAIARRVEDEDNRVVDAELAKYEQEGVIEDSEELVDFDLLRYWQSKKHIFSLLFRVALDILPVQASAVPCERVFSSSKETDSLRRCNLSPIMMEILQILKFLFRKDRLDFSNNWTTKEDKLSIIDVSPDMVQELLATGRIEELQVLLREADQDFEDSDSDDS